MLSMVRLSTAGNVDDDFTVAAVTAPAFTVGHD